MSLKIYVSTLISSTKWIQKVLNTKYEQIQSIFQNKPFARVTWAAAWIPMDDATTDSSNGISNGFVKNVPSFKTITPFGT